MEQVTKNQTIMGHDAVLAKLKRMVKAERLPHALLFYGPTGVGKSLAAKEIMAAYLCEHKNFCGECPSCRALAAGTHGDWHEIVPEVSEKGNKSIKIDVIRALQTEIAPYPVLSKGRAVLIDDAPAMNKEAMNSLLKTLEEPPGEMLFILIADSKTALLPTIVSRCAAVSFGALSAAAVEQILLKSGCGAEEAPKLAALADGSPGRALALAGTDALALARDAAAFAQGIAAMSMEAAWEKGAALDKLGKEKVTAWLRYVILTLRDGLIAKLLPPERGGEFMYAPAADGSTAPDAAVSLALIRLAEDMQKRLRYNVALKLQAESFIIRARELAKGGM